MNSDNLNREYREAINAINHPPFSDEWCKEAQRASNNLTAAFNAIKAQTVVKIDDEGVTTVQTVGPRLCRECGVEFQIERKRGRPPVKCPSCRGMKEDDA